MNYVWIFMIIFSFIAAAVNGRMDETMNAAFEGASAAVTTLLSFAGIMCFWTGLLKVAEKSKITEFIRKILNPVVNHLFPKANRQAKEYISMNITANLLGMGNAATPMGIKAMEELDKINKNPKYISDEMCMLVVINTTSLQLIPTTIIALRHAAGSMQPMSVIVPIWISSLTAFLAAVLSVKLICRFGRRSI